MSTLARLQQMRVVQRRQARELDLSAVRWLDPLHLVSIAAIAHQAHLDGVTFRLTGLDAAQTGYAARMHLDQILDGFDFEHTLTPPGREHDRSRSLHELHAIRTPRDVRTLAKLVHDRVVDDEPDTAFALHTGIAELGGNVCEHSQAAIGFIAAQAVESTSQMRFAVADAGVGLLATLTGRGARHEQGALRMALNGTSGTGRPGHGTGLPSTVMAVTELGGSAVLVSGAAASLVTQQGRQQYAVTQPFPGTLFEGRLPISAGRHQQRGARHT